MVTTVLKQWKNNIPNANANMTVNYVEACVMVNQSTIHLTALTQKHVKQLLGLQMLEKLELTDFKAKCKYTEHGFSFSEEDWKNIFELPVRILKNNKIQEMQYKILHRIVATNKWLYTVNKTGSPRCSFCGIYIETIEHLFFKCLAVKCLWMNIIDTWNQFNSSAYECRIQNIQFGYTGTKSISCEALNTVVMHGKYYIYRNKLKATSPTVKGFLEVIKFEMSIIHEYKRDKVWDKCKQFLEYCQ